MKSLMLEGSEYYFNLISVSRNAAAADQGVRGGQLTLFHFIHFIIATVAPCYVSALSGRACSGCWFLALLAVETLCASKICDKQASLTTWY